MNIKIEETTLIDCPVYEDDLARMAEKNRKSFLNMLSIQINRIMTYRNWEQADIIKKTGIPAPTLSEWVNNKVDVQKLDDNIPKLIKAIDPDTTIDFWVYGIPKTQRDFELDEVMPDLDKRVDADEFGGVA